MGKHLPYNVKCEKQLKTIYNWLCMIILENKIGNMMQHCGKKHLLLSDGIMVNINFLKIFT